MNCFKCNGSYQKKHGKLKFDDRYIGIIVVDDADYYECPKCDDQLLPVETAKLIENKRKELLEQYLQAQPIKDFLSVAETSESLKITRQALHKHKRINNGFIYQTTFSGNKVYLKKSIDLYKKNGDGRFLISNWFLQERFIDLQRYDEFDIQTWHQIVPSNFALPINKSFDEITVRTKVSPYEWTGVILGKKHERKDISKFN
jgi:predicted DNA-binding protein YlxM (UPF0122 family)